jgi:TPR repeat protein
LEKGSARAAFMMAETYDWRMLRTLQAYGVRGDTEKARQLYELAAVAGIENAQERLEALKSSSKP